MRQALNEYNYLETSKSAAGIRVKAMDVILLDFILHLKLHLKPDCNCLKNNLNFFLRLYFLHIG